MPLLVKWFGDKIKNKVHSLVDAKQNECGRKVVAKARSLAPVDTGKLRDSIGYTYDQRELKLRFHVDVPYGFFVEFGTRFNRAQPFLRPAIVSELPRVWGSEMHFPAILASANPRPSPRANVETMQRNAVINAALAKRARFRGKSKVVFFGKTSRSTRHHESRFGG